VPQIELIPTRNADGTVVLRVAQLPLRERVRRLLRERGRPPRTPLSRPLGARG
jgi:hypothetical protein